VLVLLLFVLAVVLFVPIFYRVRIVHNPEKTQVKAGISFLFPFVYVTVEYFKKLSYRVRLLGFALLDSEKPKKEKKKKEKTKKENKPKKIKKKKNTSKEENLPEIAIPESLTEQKPEPVLQPQNGVETEHPEPEEEKMQNPNPVKIGFFEKLRSKIQKIRETISNIVSKIKRLWHQKEEAKRIFAKAETKSALNFVWNKLKRLLKHVLPRKIKGYAAYGADNPATTGQVLGILSVIYARCGQLLAIRPNFVEKQLECDVELKGRIQLFTLIVIAVKVFLNQELRQLITEVKGIREIE